MQTAPTLRRERCFGKIKFSINVGTPLAVWGERFVNASLALGLNIIDRYLGKQVITGTLMGVAVLSLVFVFGNLFKEVFELLVDKNLPVESVLKFMAYILPFSLAFTIPWGFLTAVLLVFGRLSADNELVSLRMAGMSMGRICRSVFLLAVTLVVLSFWINTIVTPRAQGAMKQAMYDMVIDDPMALFIPDRVLTDFPGYSIYAEEREGDRLRHLEIFILDEYGNPIRYLQAERANIEYETAEDQLLLTLDNARIVEKDADEPKNLDKIRPGISMGLTHVRLDLAPLREDSKKLRPSTIDTPSLMATLSDSEIELKSSQKRMIKTEINKRFSFSLACFTFALVGIPLGVTAQRRETSVGFAISMVIAVIYFLFMIIADTIKDKPAAQYLMWLPNIVFIGFGAWLFMRLSKK